MLCGHRGSEVVEVLEERALDCRIWLRVVDCAG